MTPCCPSARPCKDLAKTASFSAYDGMQLEAPWAQVQLPPPSDVAPVDRLFRCDSEQIGMDTTMRSSSRHQVSRHLIPRRLSQITAALWMTPWVMLLAMSVAAQSAEVAPPPEVMQKAYETRRATDNAPVIDGQLDDAVWQTVDWTGNFLQREPAEGQSPSQATRFKVLYDDDALYFAFDLEDTPQEVSKQLARRDAFPGDWIEVNIDSYFDHRTAFSFTLSVSGTQGDEYISNDGNNWDSNWDPVWNGAAKIDHDGWTAEMRIPLSQLRFSAAAEQTWGLQINRRVYRLEERSSWQRIPKNLSGWVSNFGELRGLHNLKPKRRIELVPYAVASSESFQAEEGNPFRDGSASDFNGGIDGKIGVTNNLTIDFTINPDFGQVEADPSQVNLTAFETFFDEKRPFFIEGNDIFDLRLSPAVTGGPFTSDRLFYSRRIGRSPGLSPDIPAGGFADTPANGTILGAFKLSGKTASGLSIGLLGSVTDEETATIDLDGERSQQVVEPLTSYFVSRLRQDYRDGDTQIGGILTAAHRQLEDGPLDSMRGEAFAGGLDLSHYFHDRDYRFEANLMASELRGSTESILEAQRSSARYYQRPDNDYVDLDAERTSLGGHAGSLRLTRTNNHAFVFQSGVAWRSPGFEINDLGFMRAADGINQFTWLAYQQRNPVSIFDRWAVNFNQWADWDFGGNFLGSRFNVNGNANFRNKYNAGFGITRQQEEISNTELRGGPSSRWPGSWFAEAWVGTDPRQEIHGSIGGWRQRGDEDSETTSEVWASLTWRPTDAMRISLNPSHNTSQREMQYISTESFTDEDRFLFGLLDQETTSLTLRMDYSITPDLTVQLYASPFVSTGRYSRFKRITDPRAAAFRDRFDTFGSSQIAFDPGDDRFAVDEDRDGTADYDFSNPDFDFRDFNSNLVLRWQYRPGSTVFLVWSQGRVETTNRSQDLSFNRQLDQLFSAPAQDVVLLKISKWFTP